MRRNTFKMGVGSIIFCLLALINIAQASLILDLDSDGKILSASGIEINGTLYDVAFSREKCATLLDGCNENSDFFFTSESAANAASFALLAQLFQVIESVDYDSGYKLTNGCIGTNYCRVMTPYAMYNDTTHTVSTVYASNHQYNQYDVVDTLAVGNNATIAGRSTFAIWSLQQPTPSVPAPASGLLFVIGLLMTGLASCKYSA